MTKWIALVAAVAIVGLTPAASTMAATQSVTKPQASEFGARRHDRKSHVYRVAPPYEPHYYARPNYYRPYPYGVPAPFVFGFGPFWW